MRKTLNVLNRDSFHSLHLFILPIVRLELVSSRIFHGQYPSPTQILQEYKGDKIHVQKSHR